MDLTEWSRTMHEVYDEVINSPRPPNEMATLSGAQTMAVTSDIAKLEATPMVSNDVLVFVSSAEAPLPNYEEAVDSACEPTDIYECLEDEQEDASPSTDEQEDVSQLTEEQEDASPSTDAEEDDEMAQFNQEFLLLAADDFLLDFKEELDECERRQEAEDYGAPIPEEG